MQKQVTFDNKLIDISLCINDLHALILLSKKLRIKKEWVCFSKPFCAFFGFLVMQQLSYVLHSYTRRKIVICNHN